MGLSGLFGLRRKDPLPIVNADGSPRSGTRRAPITSPGEVRLKAVPRRAPAPLTPTPPPPVGRTASDANVLALQAANRTRRRAAAGSLPSRPKPSGTVLTPILQPKTLLGAGY